MEAALKKYQQKRKFTQTSEPKGTSSSSSSSKNPIFVLQKHQASHLHYDLRLEVNGVLKSWAIPKGPSMNPDEKRLAMKVEDHPLEYADFEGLIPEGNYGAGTVMVWDQGTYSIPEAENKSQAESLASKSLGKGRLSFRIEGHKLEGEFALVKIGPKKWLFFKKKDSSASKENILTRDKSVISGRSMIEITYDLDLDPAIKAPFPKKKIKPMLATLTDKPFDREDWLFEIKWDGYRAMARTGHGSDKLYSRNLKSFKKKFPEIFSALEKIENEAIFDGEIVVLDKSGRSDFQLLQSYLRDGRGEIVFQIFDLLYFGGYDLTRQPLCRRKEILKKILVQDRHLRFSDHVIGQGKKFFKVAQDKGLEGIMAKRSDSRYYPGKRSKEWLKIKVSQEEDVLIVGFTKPKGGRKYFGSIVTATRDKGRLIHTGDVGTGFDDRTLKSLKQCFSKLKVSKALVDQYHGDEQEVTWIKSKLVAQIKFREWTEEGLMRQPVFLGLRQDKAASEVQKSRPASKKEIFRRLKMSRSKEVEIDQKKLKLTNLDKIYWPGKRYSKKDMIDYYQKISPFILPYLEDRPLSLKRFPDGIEGESFFQKNFEKDGYPRWLKTYSAKSESAGRKINYLVANNRATLVYLANLGAIEIHPWHSRIGQVYRPDYFLFDLDPNQVNFDKVIEVALNIKEILDQVEVPALIKTSGKRGLHILCPTGAKYTYRQIELLAELMCRLVVQKMPKLTSIERMPAKRRGRVYLDYLQNAKGKTMVAPYSLRPTNAATVSTPVRWEELEKGLRPTDFTLSNIFVRIDEVGDIFSGMFKQGFELKRTLDKISKF